MYSPQQSYGRSVAIDGDIAVVGAPGDSREAGAAYVLRTTDGGASYVELAKLMASDGTYDHRFGWSVAIDGNTIVVGAPGTVSQTTTEDIPGAAYVYRTTDGWASHTEIKLAADDADERDGVGGAVAIAGGTIVVGAWNRDGGAAYVYRTTDGGRCREGRRVRHLRGHRWGHRRGRSLEGRRHGLGLCLPHERRRRHVQPDGQAGGLRRQWFIRRLRGDRRQHRPRRRVLRRRPRRRGLRRQSGPLGRGPRVLERREFVVVRRAGLDGFQLWRLLRRLRLQHGGSRRGLRLRRLRPALRRRRVLLLPALPGRAGGGEGKILGGRGGGREAGGGGEGEVLGGRGGGREAGEGLVREGRGRGRT